ncbi:MAG: polyprenyl synthetase family protein [Saprospiraceae bacterium]
MHSLEELLELTTRFGESHPFPHTPAGLYEPCDYFIGIGGKRMRPAMLLMGYELFADDVERALPLAWAVELFHNFTLIHDDIMDAAPLRRGQPTVHTRWGQTAAILSGDVMLIYAYNFLAEHADPHTLPQVLRAFNRTAIEVCEGQQMDMDFERQDEVAQSEYIRMITLKTAVLLGAALEMGAIAAGAQAPDTQRLRRFGEAAGVAFQIHDDLLDTFGDPAKFGKQVGGDILQNKKTLLVIQALETASAEDRAALRRWLSAPTPADPMEKIEAVKEIFVRNQIPQRVAEAQKAWQERAFAYLDEVETPERRKTTLRNAVTALFARTH